MCVIDRTIITLFRWYWIKNPAKAWSYAKVQTRLYGLLWVVGFRRWTGSV